MDNAVNRELALKTLLLGRVDHERALSIAYSDDRFKLDRMRRLLEGLGNPHQRLVTIHVAGTKGKGSTTAMLQAALTAAGFRVGTFTSPHIERIEERIAVDGVPIASDDFLAAIERVRPIVETLDREGPAESPTFFEMLTAMAWSHFVEAKVDFVVLEVGLGGRLDSTNVCQPAVCAITSISLDHVVQLGGSVEAIAAEKAGIVKPGVPLVSGVIEPGPRGVIRDVCRQKNAPLVELGRDFRFAYEPPRHLEQGPSCGRLRFESDIAGKSAEVELALPGRHQAANAAVALAILDLLRRQGFLIPETAVKSGLCTLKWAGRIELVGRRPVRIFDTAHNVASVAALVETLDESFCVAKRRLLFAASREKDSAGMLRLLLPRFDEVILTQYRNNLRAVPCEELAEIARSTGESNWSTCDEPVEAWRRLCERSTLDDLICAAGSFFLIAELCTHLAPRDAGSSRGAR